MDYISTETLAEQKVEDVLVHYGVKGMKWGKHLRRSEDPEVTTAPSQSAESEVTKTTRRAEPEVTMPSQEAEPKVTVPTPEANTKKPETSTYFYSGKGKDLAKSAAAYLRAIEGFNYLVPDYIEKYEEEGYHYLRVAPVSTSMSEILFENEDGDLRSYPINTEDGKEVKNAFERAKNKDYANDKKTQKLIKKAEKERHKSRVPSDFFDEDDTTFEKIKKILDLPLVYYPDAIKKAFLSHEMEDVLMDIYKSYCLDDPSDSYLEHHGIAGQKWGVRNGPPYPLEGRVSGSTKKVTVNVKNLNDDDLRRIINRLQMEKQLKDLTKEEKKKAETWVSKLGKKALDTGENIIFKSLEKVLTKKVTDVLSEKLDVD